MDIACAVVWPEPVRRRLPRMWRVAARVAQLTDDLTVMQLDQSQAPMLALTIKGHTVAVLHPWLGVLDADGGALLSPAPRDEGGVWQPDSDLTDDRLVGAATSGITGTPRRAAPTNGAVLTFRLIAGFLDNQTARGRQVLSARRPPEGLVPCSAQNDPSLRSWPTWQRWHLLVDGAVRGHLAAGWVWSCDGDRRDLLRVYRQARADGRTPDEALADALAVLQSTLEPSTVPGRTAVGSTGSWQRTVSVPGRDASVEAMSDFAGTYNGYSQMSGTPRGLERLFGAVLFPEQVPYAEEADTTWVPPDGLGVDALRGLLFLMQRAEHLGGNGLSSEQDRRWRLVIDRIHETSEGTDLLHVPARPGLDQEDHSPGDAGWDAIEQIL